MATQSQEITRIAALFPTPAWHFPIADRTGVSFSLPTSTYCKSPKIEAESAEDDSDPLQYIACFDGELLYVINRFKAPLLLLKVNLPVEMQLMDCLPEGKESINVIAYENLDLTSLHSFVKAKLLVDGTSAQDSENQAQRFTTGRLTLKVKAGDTIAQAQGHLARVAFADQASFLVHPVYVFWRWLQLERTIEPSAHTALDQFDWAAMALEIHQQFIYGAVANGAPITNTIGAYRRQGY